VNGGGSDFCAVEVKEGGKVGGKTSQRFGGRDGVPNK
jgi:hypothetical protein